MLSAFDAVCQHFVFLASPGKAGLSFNHGGYAVCGASDLIAEGQFICLYHVLHGGDDFRGFTLHTFDGHGIFGMGKEDPVIGGKEGIGILVRAV